MRISRGIALGFVAGALVTAVAALLVLPVVALTHREDLPLERRYAAFAVGLVARLNAGDAANPVADDARALEIGRTAYAGSCAVCHGARGDGRSRFGPATYPEGSDLTSAVVRGRTDAELFWIVKHGLAFTAMPAFGDAYADRDIWAIVAYVRALQRGGASTPAVPEPTAADLALADPFGDAIARGAATYYAQGCYLCHGTGSDEHELGTRGRVARALLRSDEIGLAGRVGGDAVRRPQPGMPRYGPERITDAELADLEAFLLRYAAAPRQVAVSGASGGSARH